MKDETAGVAIEECVRLNPKMYSCLVDDNSEHKKAMEVNKNDAATISHNNYKDVLLNKKYLRHSMNRIQSKDRRRGTYKINKNMEVNKNDAATISHNNYKDVLLNKKYLRHSMNRIQSKDRRRGTYKINKISLFCLDAMRWISSCLLESIIKKDG